MTKLDKAEFDQVYARAAIKKVFEESVFCPVNEITANCVAERIAQFMTLWVGRSNEPVHVVSRFVGSRQASIVIRHDKFYSLTVLVEF